MKCVSLMTICLLNCLLMFQFYVLQAVVESSNADQCRVAELILHDVRCWFFFNIVWIIIYCLNFIIVLWSSRITPSWRIDRYLYMTISCLIMYFAKQKITMGGKWHYKRHVSILVYALDDTCLILDYNLELVKKSGL